MKLKKTCGTEPIYVPTTYLMMQALNPLIVEPIVRVKKPARQVKQSPPIKTGFGRGLRLNVAPSTPGKEVIGEFSNTSSPAKVIEERNKKPYPGKEANEEFVNISSPAKIIEEHNKKSNPGKEATEEMSNTSSSAKVIEERNKKSNPEKEATKEISNTSSTGKVIEEHNKTYSEKEVTEEIGKRTCPIIFDKPYQDYDQIIEDISIDLTGDSADPVIISDDNSDVEIKDDVKLEKVTNQYNIEDKNLDKSNLSSDNINKETFNISTNKPLNDDELITEEQIIKEIESISLNNDDELNLDDAE